MNTNTNHYMDEYSNQMLEDMYPEIYHAIYPMIRQKALHMRGQIVNPQMMDSAVNDIMWNSGMMDWEEDGTEFGIEDAVPSARFGYERPRSPLGPRPPMRPRPYRPRFPMADDLIRILLLRELLGR